MTTAEKQAKARWNAKNYVQVKVSVSPEIAEAFKGACGANKVSMAGVLSRFMSEYSSTQAGVKRESDPYSTKRKRRRLVEAMIQQMERIRDAQEQARDNIPESLRDADAYEAAGESIDAMDEALEAMGRIY